MALGKRKESQMELFIATRSPRVPGIPSTADKVTKLLEVRPTNTKSERKPERGYYHGCFMWEYGGNSEAPELFGSKLIRLVRRMSKQTVAIRKLARHGQWFLLGAGFVSAPEATFSLGQKEMAWLVRVQAEIRLSSYVCNPEHTGNPESR